MATHSTRTFPFPLNIHLSTNHPYSVITNFIIALRDDNTPSRASEMRHTLAKSCPLPSLPTDISPARPTAGTTHALHRASTPYFSTDIFFMMRCITLSLFWS